MADTALVLPALPQAISREQALAALDVLGIPHTIRELTMDLYGITLTLVAQTTDGAKIRVGEGAAYITVRLPIGDDPPTTKAQHYTGQPEWCCARAFETLGKQHADCTRATP